MSHVYIHVLNWNDKQYLKDFLDSIDEQTYPHITLRILDNGSADDSLAYIQERIPQAIVARNQKNRGYAPGHNQLLRYTIDHLPAGQEAFVLIANPDMILDKHLVERLVEALKKNERLAGVQPKLFRAFGNPATEESREHVQKSDIIDTTGLAVNRGWRMHDRGAGELDKGQYDAKTDIFGATGTSSLFRITALQDIAFEQEFFDDDFHTYREDCDLAWRFKKRGWQFQFVPKAFGWHYRGMAGAAKQSWWQRLKNRRGNRPFFAALSTRNQLFLLYKNINVSEFLRSLPWIAFHEGGRGLYGMIFESETRRRLLTMPKLFKRMREKRQHIQQTATVEDKQLHRYVGQD